MTEEKKPEKKKVPPKFTWKRPDTTGLDKPTLHPDAEKVSFEVRKGKLSKTRVPFKAQITALMYEWVTKAPPDKGVREWMKENGYTGTEYAMAVAEIPVSEWIACRSSLQDQSTGLTAKRHVDSIVDMNDMHIKAAKLGLAKALEFMTKMKLEERYGKDGTPYFKGFRPSDLLRCMESISHSQKIHRMALGLSTEEGSINVWQQINKTINVGGSEVEDTVKELEKQFSYDDIRAMINANKSAIDVTPK